MHASSWFVGGQCALETNQNSIQPSGRVRQDVLVDTIAAISGRYVLMHRLEDSLQSETKTVKPAATAALAQLQDSKQLHTHRSQKPLVQELTAWSNYTAAFQ